MLDIILAIALLIGSAATTTGPSRHIGDRPPAGGIPIPQISPGTATAPGLN